MAWLNGLPEMQEMLALIREWTVVRKGDHKAVLLKMRMKDWATARQTAAAEEEKAGDRKIAAFQKQYDRVEHDVIREVSQVMGRNALINSVVAGLPPENAKKLRALIESDIKKRQEKLLEEQKREWRALSRGEEQPDAGHADNDPAASPPESGPVHPHPTDPNRSLPETPYAEAA